MATCMSWLPPGLPQQETFLVLANRFSHNEDDNDNDDDDDDNSSGDDNEDVFVSCGNKVTKKDDKW